MLINTYRVGTVLKESLVSIKMCFSIANIPRRNSRGFHKIGVEAEGKIMGVRARLQASSSARHFALLSVIYIKVPNSDHLFKNAVKTSHSLMVKLKCTEGLRIAQDHMINDWKSTIGACSSESQYSLQIWKLQSPFQISKLSH